MKHLILLCILISFSSLTNRAICQGISIELDTFMFKDGYFEEIDEAAKTPDDVLYLNLSMGHPKWKKIPEQAFAFKNLIRLDLSYNQVAGVSEKIGTLSHLEYLNLNGNHYLTNISDEIAKLEKLKELHLKDNRMSEEKIEKLKTLLPNCKIILN